MSSKKYRVFSLYFPIFHEKTTSLMPIFCWKNVHLQKTICSYALFSPNFTKKLLLSCPYSVKKRTFSKKTLCAHAYTLSKKRLFSQKHGSHLIFFFKFFMKNPCFHAHIWSNKRSFFQHYTISWAKIVKTISFLSDFSRKNNCSHA